VWAQAREILNYVVAMAPSNPPQLVLGHRQTNSSIHFLIQFFFHFGVFLISPGAEGIRMGAGEGVSVPRPSQPSQGPNGETKMF
jgi:hypothetical protein